LRPELAEISKTFHEKFCPILSGGQLQDLRADLQGDLIDSVLAFRISSILKR
jgi:hypothetical protein